MTAADRDTLRVSDLGPDSIIESSQALGTVGLRRHLTAILLPITVSIIGTQTAVSSGCCPLQVLHTGTDTVYCDSIIESISNLGRSITGNNLNHEWVHYYQL